MNTAAYEKVDLHDPEMSRDSQSEEDLETLLPSSEASRSTEELTKRFKKSSHWSRYSIVALLLASFVLSVALGAWLGSVYFSNPAKFCLGYVQNYSPVVKDVDIKIATHRFDGRLLQENVFRLPGGPDSGVDAAWESMGVDYRPIAVPLDQGEKSGLKHDQVKIKEKYGGGFVANVEGLHHLHCLNLVRKSLWFNYDYYHSMGKGAFSNNDTIVHYHVTHCLDILRQQLMCTTDTGVLGQVWWGDRSSPNAYTDFNTNHKCRNFDDVRVWAEAHQLPLDAPEDFIADPEPGDFIYEEMP